MSKLKSVFCMLLCLALTAGSVFCAGALDGSVLREVTTIHDGVTLTHTATSASSRYGLQNFNMIELDPSQSDIYIDVTGGGQYANNRATVTDTVKAFAAESPGLTPLAAVNGDLWMMSSAHARVDGSGTSYGGYSDPVVKSELTLPRGFNMYDGEIICSAYMYTETPYEGEFWSFGVTDDGQAVIGCPTLDISVTGGESTIRADGLNRLPANNSLVVYTDRGCLSNYALDDAYEILLDCGGDYTVRDGSVISGTVAGIYSSADADNPTISENTIILTARGEAVSRLAGYTVGETLSLSFDIGERYGRDADKWKKVTDAVGGHMPFVVDGVKGETGTTTGYPSTIVGIKNDGTLILIVNDGRQSSLSRGLDFNDYAALADELDINTGIILDGGGSACMSVLDGDEYKVVNSPSDGNERRVVNSLIISYGAKRERVKTDPVMPSKNNVLTSLFFSDASSLALLRPNIQTSVTGTADGAVIKADCYNGDGYVNICFGLPGTTAGAGTGYPAIDIDEYPYLVIDMKAETSDTSTAQFQTVYVSAGDSWSASGATFCCFNNLTNYGLFSRYIIDTTANPDITGQLNLIRLGYLISANGTAVKDGDGIVLRSLRAAKTYDDALAVAQFPFRDVPAGKWYTEAVGYCYQNELVAGTTAVTFEPATEVTRAMFAVILAKLDGAALDDYDYSVFDDVAEGKWYTSAITWAYVNGIVSGTGNGMFGYKNNVTREQVALMLYNYTELRGGSTSGRADLSGYSDEASVHSWAREALRWAVSEELISGTSGSTLSPRGNSTRAQIAQVMLKYQH